MRNSNCGQDDDGLDGFHLSQHTVRYRSTGVRLQRGTAARSEPRLAVEKTLPVHEAQLISYLRLSGLKVGLLINFHEKHLKGGITRRIL
ncbi:GxxExxY protein [Lacunimicrobium album]